MKAAAVVLLTRSSRRLATLTQRHSFRCAFAFCWLHLLRIISAAVQLPKHFCHPMRFDMHRYIFTRQIHVQLHMNIICIQVTSTQYMHLHLNVFMYSTAFFALHLYSFLFAWRLLSSRCSPLFFSSHSLSSCEMPPAMRWLTKRSQPD